MKLFLRNTGRFLLIGALIYIPILICYNILIEGEIERCNTIPPEVEILVMGDSHGACNINDSLNPRIENRASSDEMYYLTLHKLKDIINQDNKDIKAITLSFNYFSLNKRRENYFVAKGASYWTDNYFPIFRDLRNLPRKHNIKSRMPMLLLTNAYTPTFHRITDAPRSTANYKGGFLPNNNTIDINNTKKLYSSIDWYFGDITKFNLNTFISTIGSSHLRQIANLSKINGIQIFLINAPQHQSFNTLIPDELKEFHLKFAQQLHDEYGTLYLDYHDMNLPDSCFRDFDHLNTNGANIFTPILLADIESYLSQIQK